MMEILRTASQALRARVRELLPDAEEDVSVLYVAENEDVKLSFRVEFASVFNTVIIVEAGGSLEFTYDAREMSKNYRKVVVGEGSSLILNDLAVSGDCIEMDTQLTVKAGGTVKNTSILLGGARSRLSYTTDLVGEQAHSQQWGLFMLSGDERAEVQVAVNHRVANCRSTELIKGIASGRAHGTFDGRVYVAPDAKQTEALQQSKNILLSVDSQIVTSPQLEIYADDVKCSHGATTGQIDGDAIFYMRQRGLDEGQARRLQLAGFVNEIVEHISGGELHDEAMQLVENKLITM